MSALTPKPSILEIAAYVGGESSIPGIENPIKLSANESALGASPKAIAAYKRVDLGRYPDGDATLLRNAIGKRFGLDPARIVCGAGSDDVIHLLALAYAGSGDEVIYNQHGFLLYPIAARSVGVTPITTPEKNLTADVDAFLAAVTPRTKIVFVANPNNPTGTLAPEADVIELINNIPPHVLLVMDEAYIEFLGQPTDLLPLVRRGDFPNLILMRTFSKIFGLAGLRLGYGIGHPEFIAALEKVRQPFNINSLAQAAAFAALDDAEHLARTRHTNGQGLEYLTLALRQMGLEFVPSHANFLLVRVGDSQHVFNALQKLGVITRPMAGYQLPEWLRLSIGTAAENARALAALRTVLGK